MMTPNSSPAPTPSSNEYPDREQARGQAGVWHLAGRPLTPDIVDVLARSVSHRQPGGTRCIHHDVAVVGVSARQGQVLVAMAGRLDNGRELARAQHSGVPAASLHERDASTMLHRYVCSGPNCITELVGDWSAAIWDGRSRTLMLATDFFGTKPLYYRRTPTEITWSSELTTFLAIDRSVPPLNEQYLASWIVGLQSAAATPYQNVSRVPPGDAVILTETDTTTIRGWRPDLTSTIRYQTDGDYDAHFAELFHDAVRNRLPADGEPVWSELSGGLDSSSVTCVASNLLSQGGRSKNLTAISYVFSQSRSADESDYARLVMSPRDNAHVCLDESQFPLLSYDDAVGPLEAPLPAAGRPIAVERLMQRAGARVLLSGRGGDALAWSLSAPIDLVEYAGNYDVGATLRAASAYHRIEGLSYWELARQTLRMARDHGHGTGSALTQMALTGESPWIDWKALAALLADADKDADDIRHVPAARRKHWLMLSDTIRRFATNDFRNVSGIETRYPFLDRPLVGFMLAIPASQKRRPGSTRALHRRALSSILPKQIATRTWKAAADEPIIRALRRERDWVERILRDSVLIRRCSFISEQAVRLAIESDLSGRTSDGFLYRLLALEAWLQRLQSHEGRVTSP